MTADDEPAEVLRMAEPIVSVSPGLTAAIEAPGNPSGVPLSVIAAAAPTADAEAMLSVPALTCTVPVNPLVPLSMTLPAPFLTSPTEPLMPPAPPIVYGSVALLKVTLLG